MMQLLIVGTVIFARGPFEETDDAINAGNDVYFKNVLEAAGVWQIVNFPPASVPARFNEAGYEYQNGALVKKPPTAEQFAAGIKQFDKLIQDRIDDGARSWGYGNPNKPDESAILYALSYLNDVTVPKYQAEARALATWRSQTWRVCELALEDVAANRRPIPTEAQLLAELPAMPARPQA